MEIKHGYSSINIRKVSKEVLKAGAEGPGECLCNEKPSSISNIAQI